MFLNIVSTHLFTCAIYGHGPQKHKCYEWHSGDQKQHHTTIEVIERIEEAVEEEPTASGRLASLREEMGTDSGVEREGSLEDRMSKFFGDDR